MQQSASNLDLESLKQFSEMVRESEVSFDDHTDNDD